jgi:arylsulfatase A-like enzyme
MQRITCWLATMLGLATTAFGLNAAADARPNILYILLDDAGYGDLGCYGQARLATPNMDRLARDGMRFTQHYAGSTVCAPSRCTLMAGRHTGHAAVRGNRSGPDPDGEGEFPLPAGTVTVARLLQEAGYVTGCFGKWGLGGPDSTGQATRQGFDTFYGYYDQSYAHDYYPRWLWRNSEKIVLDRTAYAHDLIMTEALGFIRQHATNHFFCYLPVTIPHAALQAPPEDHERFQARYPQFNDVVGRYSGDGRTVLVTNPVAGFAAMMTRMDRDVGRLLELLRELGIETNTLVMLSSDNGPHHEGGHDPEFWDSNGPLRGFKRDLYEGGIRVPLLARWPGAIQPGTVSETISAHWDMLPTFCELAGARVPDQLDGLSLAPTLLGRGRQAEHEYLYWEFYEQGGKRAARFGKWKGVQRDLRDHPDSPIELYDLSTDPGETQDLAERNPDQIERTRQIFTGAHQPDAQWQYRPVR